MSFFQYMDNVKKTLLNLCLDFINIIHAVLGTFLYCFVIYCNMSVFQNLFYFLKMT